MIRYFALFAILVLLSIFFAFYPIAETRSQVANVNGLDCSKLGNVNLSSRKYARCEAYWANSWANASMNAALIEANTAANYTDGSLSDGYAPGMLTCQDQQKGTDEAYLYFLNAQDILDAAAEMEPLSYERKTYRREAVRCLTKAIALDTSNRTYLLKRAEINDDDPLLAVSDITKVIDTQPGDVDLYILRAKAYINAKQLNSALADYNKGISLEPKNKDLYLKRYSFFLVQMRDQEKALGDLNSLLDIFPSDPAALAYRAEIYRRKKDYPNALKDITLLIENEPTFSFYYLSRAMVYEESGRLDKAFADINTAIKISPTAASAYEQRAKFYRKTGRAALAIRDERTAKRLYAQMLKELEKE